MNCRFFAGPAFVFFSLCATAVAQAGPRDVGELISAQKQVQNLEITPTPPSGGTYGFDLLGSDGAVVRGAVATFTERPGYTITELSFQISGPVTATSIQSWDLLARTISKQCLDLTDDDLKPARAFYADSLDKIGKAGQGKYTKDFALVGVVIEAKFFLNKTAEISVNLYRTGNARWNRSCVDSASVATLPPKPAELQVAYVALRDLSELLTFTNTGQVLQLTLGSTVLEITIGSINAKANEVPTKLKASPFNWNGVVYIPVTVLAELFKCKADLPTRNEWKESEQQHFLKSINCGDINSYVEVWIW